MKKTLSLSIALSLFGLAFPLAASASPVAGVKPAAVTKLAESTKMYTIVAKEIESTPPGCYQCVPQKKDVPSFSPVADPAKYDSILAATKIDNFSQTTYDHSSCTGGPCNPVAETVDGACAIVAAGLSCFGANQFGQLGNEPANPATVTTPTPATNGGVALTGITDVAANGETTCIVQSDALKCVGKGNWPGLHFRTGSTSYYINTQTWSATTNSYTNSGNSANDNSYLSETLDEANTVLSSVIGTGYQGNNGLFSKTWRTLITTGVKSIQIGASNGSTPAICALMLTGTVQCANVTNGAAGTNTSSNVTRYDCSNPVDGEYESEVYCQNIQGWVNRTFKSRSENRNISETTAAGWVWVYAQDTPDADSEGDIANATDISMTAQSWGAGQLCIAAAAVTCRSFSGGKYGETGAAIEGSEGATRVYITANWGSPGLCIHNQGTLSCGAGSNGPNGVVTMPTALTAVGVMAEPLSIFMDQSISSMQKIYFVLPSGLLSADSWIFSCKQCYSNSQNVVAPVSAFADSTAKAFNYTTGIAGATDSVKLIPLKVITGVRTARSGVLLTFKTLTGDALAGATFKWATPDYPVLASSSKATNLVTDIAGTVRASIAGGPVTFTITGGTSSSGASLQASTVTVLIPDSGNAAITVASPTALITRVVKVVMENGNPVPNATIKLKNNYLSYDYANSASGTSSWATEAAGSDFGLATCSQCFVAPPVYITGDDGTVSFKSFSPKSRSSKYDALIEYDDGDLNKSIEVNFKTASDSVEMPFMPGLDVTIVDSDKTTPTVDLTANASGTVSIPLELKDESGAPYTGFTATATEVCDAADTGGLFSATAAVTDVCSSNSSSSTKTASAGARSGVRALAACTAGKATTDAKGKGVIKVCTTTSKKYRIAGVGALPSRTFCVKVKGVKCSEPVSAASLRIQNTTLAKNAVFPKGTFKQVNNGKVWYQMYKFTKALSRKSSISLAKLASMSESYERGDILFQQNPGCTGCGTLGVTTSLTPTICKVQGSYVTALKKKGICQLSTSVQYNNKINKNDRRKVFIQVN